MNRGSKLLKSTKYFKEVDLKKNKNIDFDKLAYRSGKKIFWLCDKNHSYSCTPHHRTRDKGCPYCAKGTTKATYKKSLSFLKPELSKHWNYSKNLKKPEEVLAGSKIQYWFKCEKNHDYKISPCEKGYRHTCPYCSGKKVCHDNNIKFLYPYLMTQWDYAKNLKGPENYTRGSNYKAWWICKLKHNYKTKIKQRCVQEQGCPKCHSNISKSQMRVYSELKYFFKSTVLNFLINKIEIDVYIKKLKIGIEYDGEYYHKKRLAKDIEKNKKIEKLGISLFRIREEPLNKISNNDILTKKKTLLSKEDINQLLKKIVELKKISKSTVQKINSYFNFREFINSSVYNDLINDLPFPPKELSFFYKYPDLMKEWNFKKNLNLDPKSLYANTRIKIWWTCIYGHEWLANLSDRTSKNSKCKICSDIKRNERWISMNKSRRGKKRSEW